MSVAKLLDEKLDTLLVSGEADDILMRRDLSYFAEKVLNMEISDHHLEWSSLASNDDKWKRIGINAPRDHGKSFM